MMNDKELQKEGPLFVADAEETSQDVFALIVECPQNERDSHLNAQSEERIACKKKLGQNLVLLKLFSQGSEIRKQIPKTLPFKFLLSPFQHCMHKDKCTHTCTNVQSFKVEFRKRRILPAENIAEYSSIVHAITYLANAGAIRRR